MHPKFTLSRNDVGSPRSTSSMRIFQVGSMFSVLPVSLISSTYTDKKSPFSRLTNKLSLVKTFPNRVPFFQIGFPIIVLPKDDRTESFREERMDLPYWTMMSAILCFGRRFQMSGHSVFGIFRNFGASSILT